MSELQGVLHLKDVTLDSLANVRKNHVERCIRPLKSQISTLKCATVQSQVALLFWNELENVAGDKENWLASNEAQEKELMNKCKKESDIKKARIAEVERDLEKLAETIQAGNENIKAKKSFIENKLSVMQQKEEKLKKFLERKQWLEEQKQLRFTDSEKGLSKEGLQKKWRETNGAMKQCMAAIDSLNEHTSLLKSEQNSLQESLPKLEQRLSTLHAKRNSLHKEERERSTELLMSSGIRVVNVTENTLTVAIQDILDQETNSTTSECAAEIPAIQVTLHFVEVDGQILVKDVETNSLTYFIKDVIEQVKFTRNFKGFILEVQKRFHNQVKVLKEMKTLQERFAIDWNDERQIVRVMLGKSGQIVCTLKIQDGYASSGRVSLEGIHGADQEALLQDRSTTEQLRSLTSWIEYLFEKYNCL